MWTLTKLYASQRREPRLFLLKDYAPGVYIWHRAWYIVVA